MPKRLQMDFMRPQTAYKTLRQQPTYTRSVRDERIADEAMLYKSEYSSYSFQKPKSPRRIIKRIAKVERITPLLGLWKTDGYSMEEFSVVIEPSKYIENRYVYQTIALKVVGGVNKKAELLTLKELAKRLVSLRKNKPYQLTEKYDDYKGDKSYLSRLTKEETEIKKEEELLKQEKLAEPFYNWLSN